MKRGVAIARQPGAAAVRRSTAFAEVQQRRRTNMNVSSALNNCTAAAMVLCRSTRISSSNRRSCSLEAAFTGGAKGSVSGDAKNPLDAKEKDEEEVRPGAFK